MTTPRRSAKASRSPLAGYAGRWIALVGEQVVGQGGTPEQARRAAQSARFKEILQIRYVPTPTSLQFSPLLEHINAALPADIPVYLVGGVVRDALLGRASHDWDFAVQGDALRIARQVADQLGAAYFPLDAEHDTGRVILNDSQGERTFLDFVGLRGPDLESDLAARDFTINAMALEARDPQKLLDPLGGAADLHAQELRACSPTSLRDDPLRILRGIRQAADLGFKIVPPTRALMRQAIPGLKRISPERLRDELFRILGGRKPTACLRAIDLLGALAVILPEVNALHGVEQSPPHQSDVWQHSLDTLQKLEDVLAVLAIEYDPDKAANLVLGEIVLRLGRYRQHIAAHFEAALNTDRPLRPLLFLAALYHDIDKPQTRQVEENGRVRFFQHEHAGANTVAGRGRALHLSNAEIERLQATVRYHMRPFLLAQSGPQPTRRAIYRFFRDAGPAGVEVCLLSLADFLATYGSSPPQEEWDRHLSVIRTLLEAWWEHPEESIAPPPLLNGHDLITALRIPAGPQVGNLLEAVREAQAGGQVNNREEALELARKLLAES